MAKLHFYYSAMNAGKTTTLLQSNYNYEERGMRTLLYTPIIDDRVAVGVIASRIGLEAKANTFDSKFDLFQDVLRRRKSGKIDCILLDEAHFLTKAQVYQLTEIVDRCNIPVLAYGLRSDYRGELFEGSMYLLAWAEELEETKTICHCGSKATTVLRIDENGEVIREGQQVHIGGNDAYVSVCRKHYKAGQTTTIPQRQAEGII